MSTTTATRPLSFSCFPLSANQTGYGNNSLDIEKVLSRVAEIRIGWSVKERENRRKMGEIRRKKLMSLMQNKAA